MFQSLWWSEVSNRISIIASKKRSPKTNKKPLSSPDSGFLFVAQEGERRTARPARRRGKTVLRRLPPDFSGRRPRFFCVYYRKFHTRAIITVDFIARV